MEMKPTGLGCPVFVLGFVSLIHSLTSGKTHAEEHYRSTQPAAPPRRTHARFFHLLGGCRYLSMPSVSPGSSRTPKTVSSSAWVDGQRRRLLAACAAGARAPSQSLSAVQAARRVRLSGLEGRPGQAGGPLERWDGPHGLPRARPLCPCGYRLDARMVTGCGASSCALSFMMVLTTSLSTPWPRRTWSGFGFGLSVGPLRVRLRAPDYRVPG